jgi:hypothetical protein
MLSMKSDLASQLLIRSHLEDQEFQIRQEIRQSMEDGDGMKLAEATNALKELKHAKKLMFERWAEALKAQGKSPDDWQEDFIFELIEEGVTDSEAIEQINSLTEGMAETLYKLYKRYSTEEE